jgi:hypothetical protein
MASGARLRSSGQRREANVKSQSSNIFNLPHGNGAERRVNVEQAHALEHLFQGSPAVQAARTVLSGQLLGGGIALFKDGEEVELQPAFREHLSQHWVPFAQDVIDCFLKWGYAVISYEEDEEEVQREALLAKRRKLAEPPPTRPRSSKAAKAADKAQARPPLIVPIIPALGSYELAFKMGGRVGYRKTYLVYTNAPSLGTREDEEARVVVRQAPDAVGNINSPLASVFELGSFVGSLTELALTAESSRARPHLITQMRKKDTQGLDPSTLFFDTESRGVQSNIDNSESQAQAKALQMQTAMCAMINRLQTQSAPQASSSSIAHKTSFAPPEVPPSIFNIPKEQESVPGISSAESRGDLESLMRIASEQFCSAFGVPADLIFSGRFAGKSGSQLTLLNTTVSQLAKDVNFVLTMAYRDIYANTPDEDVGQLQLSPSSITSSEEVLALHGGGLLPTNVALPLAMNSVGASRSEIENALKEAEEKQKQEEQVQKDTEEFTKESNELNLQERKQAMKVAAAGGGSGGGSGGGGASKPAKPSSSQ